jgi:hypothetical protein
LHALNAVVVARAIHATGSQQLTQEAPRGFAVVHAAADDRRRRLGRVDGVAPRFEFVIGRCQGGRDRR